jgi:acyl-CoA reductase-like NAD-dependent aldehyde dehydrogenase
MHVGDPREAATSIGPMVTRKQYERVQGYIKRGIDEGATLLTGGLGRPQGLERGYLVRPTVFGNVSNQMSIAREEIFGPVLSVIPMTTKSSRSLWRTTLSTDCMHSVLRRKRACQSGRLANRRRPRIH